MQDNYQDNLSKENSLEIRQLVNVLFIILIGSLGSKHIVSLFDNYIVSYTLGLIYKQRLNAIEAILTLSIFFYCIYLISEGLARTRYKVRYYFIVLMAVPLILYLYERMANNKYEFTTILGDKTSEAIKFLYFPFTLLAITIMVLAINRLQETKPVRSVDLLTDLPLLTAAHDNFERKRVYENLVNQIITLNYNDKRSFNVGIVNKWGVLYLERWRFSKNMLFMIMVKYVTRISGNITKPYSKKVILIRID